jgi:hypothetical protein
VKTSITFEIDTAGLESYTDQHLATLWHIAQQNPAPLGDLVAEELAEQIGREIIRRFLRRTPAQLWAHKGGDHLWAEKHLKKHADPFIVEEEVDFGREPGRVA